MPGLTQWAWDLAMLWAVVQVTDSAWIPPTPSLGTSICCECDPYFRKKKKKKKKKGNPLPHKAKQNPLVFRVDSFILQW